MFTHFPYRLRTLVFVVIALCVLASCGKPAQPPPTSTPLPSPTDTPVPPSPTPEPSPTPIPPTPTPLPTDTPTPEPSPTPVLNPVPQGYHPMVYDSESNVIIVVSNQANNYRVINNQTWVFDLETHSWEKRKGPPINDSAMAYDAQSDRTILFIGNIWSGGRTGSITPEGQTWAYDYNTDTWTNMNPEESPYNLLGARMVYDSESDRIILFSGWDIDIMKDKPDTWAYDFETNIWTNMQPDNPPPGENYFSMSYDAAVDRVVVWRRSFDGKTFQPVYKIGLYDYNTNTWEQREQAKHPEAYVYNTLTYDPMTGLNFLFGGIDRSDTPYNELWGYDVASNTWKKVAAKNTPSARGWHAMAYHEQAGVLVMFGGGPTREDFTNELYIYDPASNEWTDYTLKP